MGKRCDAARTQHAAWFETQAIPEFARWKYGRRQKSFWTEEMTL